MRRAAALLSLALSAGIAVSAQAATAPTDELSISTDTASSSQNSSSNSTKSPASIEGTDSSQAEPSTREGAHFSERSLRMPAASPTTPQPSQPSSPTPSGPQAAGTHAAPLRLDSSGKWLLSSGNRWWWRNADGTYPASKWATEGTHTYAFDAEGWIRTGWYKEGDTWYYFHSNGQMAKGWVAVGGTWYYMNAQGAMQTGWLKDGAHTYYLEASGAMATGWKKLGGQWYYFHSNGQMARGWAQAAGTWYYMNADGVMQTGWLKDGNLWYHLKANGAMSTGWLKDGAHWYYLKSNGQMGTGWVQVGSTWYYMYSGGAMATGTIYVDGKAYTLRSDGAWVGYQAPAGYLQPTDTITSLGWRTNDLTSGMNGIKVRIVQQRLGISDGSRLASADATFQSAVRNFQRRVGLPQTGSVDQATWNAMGTGFSWYVDQYQATPISLSATKNERIETMIGYAWNQLGSSYTWGGAGTYGLGYDCSGLVLQSLYRAGMDPQPIDVIKHAWPSYRTSQELYKYNGFQHVPFSQRQRGDLIFYRSGGTITHVSIYLGGDQVIHTDWMGRPARVDHVTAGYSWGAIDSQVVRPFP